MTISHSHFTLLQETITNLSSQITSIQSQNTNLIQTLQTLQTKITEANLPKIASKLQSITNKFIAKTSHKRSRFASNANLITSYLETPTSSSCNETQSQTHEHIQQSYYNFYVRSSTIHEFLNHEGSTLFELIEAPTNMLLNMMDSDTTKYIFGCKSCHKFAKQNIKKIYKYIHLVILTESDLTSTTILKQMKRGIEKHVNDASLHIQSIQTLQTQQSLTSPLYVKVETVYFILKRSCPVIVFEDLMVYIQQLIDYFQCDTHNYCLDIGDKQQSMSEARRIIKIFGGVVHKQTIHIIQNSLYLAPDYNIVLYSISIDGWSRG